MRPYQQSLLDQHETFIPVVVSQEHEMVILSKNLDWNLMQTIAEIHREKVVVSTRGQGPRYRSLSGAMVVRTLKNSTFRETEDLIQNYNPARYLCDLHNSQWTPDHVAIWEYEGMLGEEGLQEMTDYILRTAADLGFADPRGLCTDTTAPTYCLPYGHLVPFYSQIGFRRVEENELPRFLQERLAEYRSKSDKFFIAMVRT